MDQYLKAFNKFLSKKGIESMIAVFLLGFILGWFVSIQLNEVEEDAINEDVDLIGESQFTEIDQEAGENMEVSLIEPNEYPVEGGENVQNEEACVDVSGAVVSPGVYCMSGKKILIEVVEKAGGFKVGEYAGRYVAQNMNLAKGVSDEMKLYIPYQEEVKCTLKQLAYEEVAAKEDASLVRAGDIGGQDSTDPIENCVNINTSSKSLLTSIDGIGDVTAQSIIDNRPYESVEDLLEISGIGEAKLDSMRPSLCDL